MIKIQFNYELIKFKSSRWFHYLSLVWCEALLWKVVSIKKNNYPKKTFSYFFSFHFLSLFLPPSSPSLTSSISLSFSFYLLISYLFPSFYLSLSFPLSLSPSLYLVISFSLPLYLSISYYIYISICASLPLYLFISLSLSRSPSIYLSLSLPLFLPLSKLLSIFGLFLFILLGSKKRLVFLHFPFLKSERILG